MGNDGDHLILAAADFVQARVRFRSFRLEAADGPDGPAHQQRQEHTKRNGKKGGAKGIIIEPLPVSPEARPPKEKREKDREGKEAPRQDAARLVVHKHPGKPRGARGKEYAQGQDEEYDGRVQRHRNEGRMTLERSRTVSVASYRQQRSKAGQNREGLGDAIPFSPEIGRYSRESYEHEIQSRVWGHAIRKRLPNIGQLPVEKDLIKVRQPLHEQVGQLQQPHQGHQRCQDAPGRFDCWRRAWNGDCEKRAS